MPVFSGMIGGQWFDNIKPETQAYFTRNPDVLKSYQDKNYGKSADQFAQFHYDNFGNGEKRVWGALPAESSGSVTPTGAGTSVTPTGAGTSVTSTGAGTSVTPPGKAVDPKPVGYQPVTTGVNGGQGSQPAGAGSTTAPGTVASGAATNQQLDVGGIVGSVLKGLEPLLSNSNNKSTTPVTQQVDQSQLTSSQLSSILAGNSALNQQAQSNAMQIANSRGMANSSMAAGMGTEALISQALPIAQSNSSMYANQAAINQNALNQFALTNLQGEIQSNLAKSNFGYSLGSGIVNNFLQSKRDDAERDFQRETAATGQGYALDRMRAEYSQQDKARLSQNDFAAGQQDKQNTFVAGQQDKQNTFVAGQQEKQNAFTATQQDKSQAFQLEQLKQNMNLAYDKMTVDQVNTYAQGYLNLVQSNMLEPDKSIAVSRYSSIYGFHDGFTPATGIDMSPLPKKGGG